MKFLRPDADTARLHDAVFEIASAARADAVVNGDLVVNATIGTLYGEDGKLVALKSVYDHYDMIDHRIKAAYASSFSGTPGFRSAVFDWVTAGKLNELPHTVIAMPGGTGSISSSFHVFMKEDDTVILPDICWSNYRTMAHMHFLNTETYQMFDGDHLNLPSIRETIAKVQETCSKVFLVVNDPCHNPTGYSMTDSEWQELIAIINKASEKTPVILLDDIAYIDFAYSRDPRAYMRHFRDITDNVMVIISFSCSKSLSYYGMRCGASVLLSKDAAAIEAADAVLDKYARTIWSSISNSAMVNFVWVIHDNLNAYLKERNSYVDMLKQRSDLFLREAEEAGLDLLPYREGFFITLRGHTKENAKRLHQALIDEHIYTVLLGENLRSGICSLPLNKVKGLAARIRKAISDNGLD